MNYKKIYDNEVIIFSHFELTQNCFTFFCQIKWF